MKGVVTVKGMYIMVHIVSYVLYEFSVVTRNFSSLVQRSILVEYLYLLVRRTKVIAMKGVY